MQILCRDRLGSPQNALMTGQLHAPRSTVQLRSHNTRSLLATEGHKPFVVHKQIATLLPCELLSETVATDATSGIPHIEYAVELISLDN